MRKGFTIVELLIVIVVISLLAAITIVAYNGIQQRARASQASTALTQAKKKLELYKVDNGNYPTTGSLASAGVSNGDVDFQYTSNGVTYCITGTAGNISYKASDSTSPAQGGCAGHGQGGVSAVTNLSTNPSFEGGTPANWGINSTYTAYSVATGSTPAGSKYLRISRTATGDAYVSHTVSPTPPPNAPYTLSFWIWADSATTLDNTLLFRTNNNGSCCVNIATIGSRPVTTTPTRVTMSGNTGSNPTGGLQVILRTSSTIGQNIHYDGFMITEGSTSYTYGDGDSTDWSWNGTPNLSTSTGPPL